jgi:hypothetical protein
MADYSPLTWVDDDGSGTVGTAVTAARMNNIEQGIEDAAEHQYAGVLADRPAANAASKNHIYLATDVDGGTAYLCDGDSWEPMGPGVDHTHPYSDLTSIPASIDAIDGLTPAADRIAYYTSGSAAALTPLTSFGRSLIDDADAATARATLGAAASTHQHTLADITDEGALASLGVGTGLESSGGNLRIAATAAGDGLTGGAGSALAVGEGTGIDVTADAVAIDTTVVPRLAVANVFTAAQSISITSVGTTLYGGWTNVSHADIDSLIAGTTAGTLIQGPVNGHITIALKDNDAADSFAVVTGGGNWSVDSTYDTLAFSVDASGDGQFAGKLVIGYTGDASLANDGGLVIGDTAGANLTLDANEVIARNAGAAAALFINNDGGLVTVGSGGLNVTGGLTASAGLAMNAQKITGLANGTNSTDAVAFGQIGAAGLLSVGVGLESSGGTLRIAAAAAGNGLTGGAGSALAVGAGTGISVAADTVGIDTAVVPRLTADNTFTQSITIDGGDPEAFLLRLAPQAGASSLPLSVRGSGHSFDVLNFTDGGTIQFGGGSVDVDTVLSRLSAGVLGVGADTILTSATGARLASANALSAINTWTGATGWQPVRIIGGTNLASEASYFSAQGRARFGYDGTGVLIDDGNTSGATTTKRIKLASGAAIILEPATEITVSQYINLGSAASTIAADAAGTGVGDKLGLYTQTLATRMGFGIQASRLVAFVPAASAFAVRPTQASGQASAGSDVFSVNGAWEVTFAGVLALSNKKITGLAAADAAGNALRYEQTVTDGTGLPNLGTDFQGPPPLDTPASVVPGANVTHYIPVVIPCRASLTGITYRTGGTANGNATVALYTAAGVRTAVSAATAQGSANALKPTPFTGGPIVVTPGIYYMAIALSSATGTWTAHRVITRVATQAASVPSPGTISPATSGNQHPMLATY